MTGCDQGTLRLVGGLPFDDEARDYEPKVYTDLVSRLNAAVAQQRLSILELVAASALPETRIESIMLGEARNVTLRELVGLSLALGVSIQHLLTPL